MTGLQYYTLWLVSIFSCLNFSLSLLWISSRKKLNKRRIRDPTFVCTIPASNQYYQGFLSKKDGCTSAITLQLQENSPEKPILFCGFETKGKRGEVTCSILLTTANQNPGWSSGQVVWLSHLSMSQQEEYKNCYPNQSRW